MTITAGRYFDGSKHVLNYLADEHFEDEAKQETLLEALALVQAAECDLFSIKECPICDTSVKALGEEESRKKLDNHKSAIHKSSNAGQG